MPAEDTQRGTSTCGHAEYLRLPRAGLLAWGAVTAPTSAETLYRALVPYVSRVASHTWRKSEVPDGFVHDVVCEVIFSLSSFRGEGDLESWIYSLVRRQAWKRILQSRRQRFLLSQNEPLTSSRSSVRPDDALCLREDLSALAGALRRLPDRQRECILLSALEGLSVLDIAGVLGMTPAAVRTAVCRGRARLRSLAMGR